MEPQRIQLERVKGWRMPANSAKVDRSTIFGNPFTMERYEHEEAVELHRAWITGQLTDAEIEARWPLMVSKHLIARRRAVLELLPKLRGKNLGCWCPLPKPGNPDVCHAVVLLVLANQEQPPTIPDTRPLRRVRWKWPPAS
jgi:Domain of unknown function (DUF4326)